MLKIGREKRMDLLRQAAQAWLALTAYEYHIVCAKRKTLHDLYLRFAPDEFYHVAGFPHLNDIVLPIRFSQTRAMDKVLQGAVEESHIDKSQNYLTAVRPRLLAIIQLKTVLDRSFSTYTFDPNKVPAYTKINASYLITGGDPDVVFLFTDRKNGSKEIFSRSIFLRDRKDYRQNQTKLTLLLTERKNLRTQEYIVLYRHKNYEM